MKSKNRKRPGKIINFTYFTVKCLCILIPAIPFLLSHKALHSPATKLKFHDDNQVLPSKEFKTDMQVSNFKKNTQKILC